jgi:hypothetical protein
MPKFSIFYFKNEYSMYSLFGMGSRAGFSVDNLPTTHAELFTGVDAASKEALFPTF